MKEILMNIAVFVLRIIYTPFKLLKIKNKLTIISRQSDKPTIDIILLYKSLSKHKQKTVVLTKTLNNNFIDIIKYGMHMLKQMYHIATSRIIVVDSYCILISILCKKKEQKVVQIWHALGAIKQFGYQTIGKTGGNDIKTAKIMCMHKNYDYVIAPSMVTAKYFSEAFNITEDKIKLLALPRVDYLLHEGDIEDKIFEKYPQLINKTNVLYVPTFRKNSNVDINVFIDNFDFNKYNLILKKHPLDKTDYHDICNKEIIIDNSFASMDWLKVCRKVITDYSAIAFEAAILERELYLYVPDIVEYDRSVGLNLDFSGEVISEYIFSNVYELCDKLNNDYNYKKIIEFKRKYVSVNLYDCTEQLVCFILDLLKE